MGDSSNKMQIEPLNVFRHDIANQKCSGLPATVAGKPASLNRRVGCPTHTPPRPELSSPNLLPQHLNRRTCHCRCRRQQEQDPWIVSQRPKHPCRHLVVLDSYDTSLPSLRKMLPAPLACSPSFLLSQPTSLETGCQRPLSSGRECLETPRQATLCTPLGACTAPL